MDTNYFIFEINIPDIFQNFHICEHSNIILKYGFLHGRISLQARNFSYMHNGEKFISWQFKTDEELRKPWIAKEEM